MPHTNPSRVSCLSQELAKVLVAMQVVVHLKVGISAAMSSKQMQTISTTSQFLKYDKHRTPTFLKMFFFPRCDQKSDSEVHHIQTYTHTDYALTYSIA